MKREERRQLLNLLLADQLLFVLGAAIDQHGGGQLGRVAREIVTGTLDTGFIRVAVADAERMRVAGVDLEGATDLTRGRCPRFRSLRRSAFPRETLEQRAIENGLAQAACRFERLRKLGRNAGR